MRGRIPGILEPMLRVGSIPSPQEKRLRRSKMLLWEGR
jgi:hypothetical protein